MERCISRQIAEYVYEVKSGKKVIVYAPILQIARLIDPYSEGYGGDISIAELSEKSRQLIEKNVVCVLRPIESPLDMDKMVVLPNYKCNLSCSYCYAAMGRSNEEIDVGKLDSAIDWFLAKDRIPEKDLQIFIVGGGEPMMSWGVVTEIIKKVVEARRFQKRRISLVMTTNGSLITEERARFLADSDIMVNVSFEIIQEVQNRQRGMCNDVERGIKELQRAGAKFAIRATVSPLSVDRMSEMVDIVLHKFPHVRRLHLEAMLAGEEVFKSSDSLREFLKRYRNGFSEASARGGSNGLKVMSSAASLNMATLKERFCQGDLCLTPRGEFSICRRFSSPNEENFHHTVYGHIGDGGVKVDEEKYQRALKFSFDDRDRCRECFLRWHCGGLCLSQQTIFPSDYYDVLCDFTCEEGFEQLERFAINGDF